LRMSVIGEVAPSSTAALPKVHEMAAIRQKLGESVDRLSGFSSCNGHRIATCYRQLEERSTHRRSEYNHSLRTPSTSASDRSVGQHLRCTTHDVDAAIPHRATHTRRLGGDLRPSRGRVARPLTPASVTRERDYRKTVFVERLLSICRPLKIPARRCLHQAQEVR
jgi:hypothetical protein